MSVARITEPSGHVCVAGGREPAAAGAAAAAAARGGAKLKIRLASSECERNLPSRPRPKPML